MPRLVYIDTSTPNDYDTVIRFLNENKVPVPVRDKVRLVVGAELPGELLPKLRALELEDLLMTGDDPAIPL